MITPATERRRLCPAGSGYTGPAASFTFSSTLSNTMVVREIQDARREED
jgi:hypothetical protein